MAESASFRKGYKNIPGYILLELQTGQEVQVYDVRVQFTARFGGMRWMMYNHRIISFIVFVSAFWFAEVAFAGLGWILLRSLLTPTNKDLVKRVDGFKSEDGETIKTEEETDEPDLSDTPRTFPTYGRQAPLRYVPKIKDEDSEEYIMDETAIQPLTAEADDESEVFGGKSGRTDSGIGTSFSEGGERNLSRRRSRGGIAGGG
jgi:seipin